MEHRSDVQSLGRGLRILEVVNEHPGSSTAELALACKLPRTTTHRLLVTLAQQGFVRRDEWTQRYLPTSRVLRLVSGFDLTARLTERAQSVLNGMKTSLDWPMNVSTRDQLLMRVRASTDRLNPLAVHKLRPGAGIPLLQCAAGLAWLAAQPAAEREQIIEDAIPQPAEVPWRRSDLERALGETERRGFAVFRRPQRFSALVGISVPVRIDGRVDAALSVQFAERAISVNAACERFLPHLNAAAAALGDSSYS